MGQHGKYRTLVEKSGRTCAGICAALLLGAAPAAAYCRLALAIGLDTSASVDPHDYALEMGGMADALSDPAVKAALLADPGSSVRIAVFHWAGARDQHLFIPWTEIHDAATVGELAATLTTTARRSGGRMTGTGAAMAFGARLLAGAGPCDRLILDLASDGMNNTGLDPSDVTLPPQTEGMTINVLAVGQRENARRPGALDPGLTELTDYYRAHVIRGPGAFVEEADGFEDFRAGMQRKLLRELESLFAALPVRPDTPRG